MKDFTRIDRSKLEKTNLEGSQLVIDLNTSCIGYLNKSMIEEKEEPDEFQKEIINKLNEAEAKAKKKKKDDHVEPISDIEKLIWESYNIINGDGMVVEPKVIPFIPGNSKKILL